MTYAELVQKIRDYTEVGSEVLTSTIVNGFIRDSEFKIFREADADYAREYATSTFTANNKYLVLPNSPGSSGTNTDRRALIVRSVVATNTSGIQVSLEPRDDTFITEYNSSGATGFPKYYATFRENANLKTCPEPESKSCTPPKSSDLNVLHTACDIAIYCTPYSYYGDGDGTLIRNVPS